MLTSNQIEILFPSIQMELTADRFKPHYRYEMKSKSQIRTILKTIPIDQKETLIFKVLDQAINLMMSTNNLLGEKFVMDIDARIKLAVIYNDFRRRYSHLYGNLNRNQMIFQYTLLIFDTYLNADGEDVYYLAFTCNPRIRSFEKYEATQSIVIGGEVIKNDTWNEEINIDFVKNTVKENEESVKEYYKKYGDTLSYEEKKLELDLLKMISCYEKSYGRYFIDSADEWRKQDKVRKLQIESNKEIQKVIKEQKEKDRKQKEKEELIQKTDFHNNLKEKELPKRFFENKSTDYNRTDFIRPNHDKSNYSVSSFNSYNKNDTKIIKDNSLLKKKKFFLKRISILITNLKL
jgi:hypothetical protein